ncbi:MAG: PP2C family protein-serine/threonine phosphatase [Nocardiopsaceae bacterium]|nr:PP2C family protein-serine/threonine phosphatase [Nocardiopsaceae bacterium]
MTKTPFGIRVIVCDVMGKGLPAVQTASRILHAFHELAQHERTLSGVATHLNALLAHGRDDGRFATALIAAISGDVDRAEFVSCGHPVPLLLRGKQVTFVESAPPSPPLGLLDFNEGRCETTFLSLHPDDRILLYTDGVTEARDENGCFYPFPARVSALNDSDPGALLDALRSDLLRHSRDRSADDAMLMLLQRDVPEPVRKLVHGPPAARSATGSVLAFPPIELPDGNGPRTADPAG